MVSNRVCWWRSTPVVLSPPSGRSTRPTSPPPSKRSQRHESWSRRPCICGRDACRGAQLAPAAAGGVCDRHVGARTRRSDRGAISRAAPRNLWLDRNRPDRFALSRHTRRKWQLWPDIQLRASANGVWASGGHLELPTRLADVVEPTRSGHFLLQGRTADLVNIAGKRSSLAYLTHQLTQIPGVTDGAFHFPDDSPAKVARLSALRGRTGDDGGDDSCASCGAASTPVFLPRPLLLVDTLPRNATGKLPRSLLTALSKRQGLPGCLELSIPADHLAFAGHFPGKPDRAGRGAAG